MCVSVCEHWCVCVKSNIWTYSLKVVCSVFLSSPDNLPVSGARVKKQLDLSLFLDKKSKAILYRLYVLKEKLIIKWSSALGVSLGYLKWPLDPQRDYFYPPLFPRFSHQMMSV